VIFKKISNLKKMSTPRRAQVATPEKPSGIAPTAFGISITFLVVMTILVIVLMILYFRRDATLIKASECPEKLEGLLLQANKVVSTVATNCGSQVDCQFQVSSVQAGVDICNDLGVEKCAAFSLTQIPNSDNYDMKVSSATTTSVSVGTETYRILL